MSEYEKLEPSDVFSAMPPVESLKALVSHMMTKRVDKCGRILVLAVFDVSRAHFYGLCERDVYVEPPAELHVLVLWRSSTRRCTERKMRVMRGRSCGGEHLRNNGKELKVLHRSVRVINDELMEIEADQKHVPRLLEDLGLIQGNVVKTPRVKLSATESDAIENSSILFRRTSNVVPEWYHALCVLGTRSCRHL